MSHKMVNAEPGSVSSSSSSMPPAKQALAQKRNVRNLNTRLEMYVRAQQEKDKTINNLKGEIARNQLEYKEKLKQQKLQLSNQMDKFSKEIKNLTYDNKRTHQELDNANLAKKEFEQRLMSSESRNAALTSECESLRTEINRSTKELDSIRKMYAELKYKYDSYELERNTFDEKMAKFKLKNEQLLRELTQRETDLKSKTESYQSVLMEKNDEIDHLKKEIKDLELTNNSTQSRLRKEFDEKLADFINKREDQYKQEKNEWMRIFKEEFNRKLRSFKEANQELSHANIKQSEENTDLRTRISKLKQQKMELEVQNRGNEEENDKLRTDLDNLRRQKDAEIKEKNGIIIQQRDAYKAKELQFDELAGIKLQLDQEIELYRSILNEAEQASGYVSPLSSNNNHRGTRKRKRLNNMTPMGPIMDFQSTTNSKPVSSSSNTNSNNGMNMNGGKVETPGIGRAAKNAQNDIKQALKSDGSMAEDEEMKDKEEDDSEFDEYSTPGNLEGARLQFSGLDLLKGMIEIKNFHEEPICLNGYTLSNQDGSAQYDLPKDMILAHNEKLRVYCGEDIYKQLFGDDADGKDGDETIKRAELIGDYKGSFVCWGRNVWTGLDADCARLYNPTQEEIARMEISPDMVDMATNSKSGCFIM